MCPKPPTDVVSGGALLAALIDAAEHEGIWTIQSSIFPENTASLHLHQRHGFREVGRRERIVLMTRVTLRVVRRSFGHEADGLRMVLTALRST